MNPKDIAVALNYIDPVLVEEAAPKQKKKTTYRWLAAAAGLVLLVGGGLLLALALSFFWFTGRSAAEWNKTWVPLGNLIFSLVLPIAIIVWKGICEKWHRRGISCG